MSETAEITAYVLRACAKRKIRVIRYESADGSHWCHMEFKEKTSTATARSEGAAIVKAFINLADPSMDFID